MLKIDQVMFYKIELRYWYIMNKIMKFDLFFENGQRCLRSHEIKKKTNGNWQNLISGSKSNTLSCIAIILSLFSFR